MADLREIMSYLEDNSIYCDEMYEENNQVVISIEWGDWKHDHKLLDYLMSQKNFTLVQEVITDENGSDCYSSNHYYEQV